MRDHSGASPRPRYPVLKPDDYLGEINAVIARSTESDGLTPTAVDHLFFGRQSSPSLPMHLAQWPCFALVTQGAKRLTLGDEVFHYGVGDCLLVTLDLPVVSCIVEATPERPKLSLGMAIDSARLQEVLSRVSLPPEALRCDTLRGVAVHKAPLELLDAMLRLVRLLERPQDIAAMAPLIEQEILYRLLTGPHGPTLLRIASANSPGNKIARAIAWLRQHYAQPLRIDALAQHVGMSPSSLHHHFSQVTAMTPLQYQKRLRLQEARRLMLVDCLDVGSAGYRVGYQSASQFSREYSRQFGLSPLRDVESARGTGLGYVALADAQA
ncbi:MAG: helix-turn-helix domain-containing protein [Hydrogenophaga sp.]|nr:helix-turn-helix domain-containing protein [Hydrogenophaga sp.]NIN28865.1 helix-turn-helix domain-containing protein [Hydrogenophaga sp.]NIN33324.1 helix-turn-helix domain-containing protein [Hydrogenophaga sp.]NIN57999.1 helix-turn-helix domain-containing protein [Hydrogenophaga sp.]NIO54297.1 helix-turn-helix domain-containing protein [Hydrogenophaga sp.]